MAVGEADSPDYCKASKSMNPNFKPVPPSDLVKSSFYLLCDFDDVDRLSRDYFVRPVLPARFFRKVRFDVSGCWIWTGSSGFHPRHRQHRYGQITIWNRNTRTKMRTTAHRFAYVVTFGSIPDAYDVDHLCQNKMCVNPQHLEAVTHAENCQRRAARRKEGVR